MSVKEAFKLSVEGKGLLCTTVTEALELVFDYDEKQRQKPTTSPSHDGLPLPPPEAQVSENLQPPAPRLRAARDTNSQESVLNILNTNTSFDQYNVTKYHQAFMYIYLVFFIDSIFFIRKRTTRQVHRKQQWR